MTVIASILVAGFRSQVEKKGEEYVRTSQFGGPGSRRDIRTISEHQAAELCCLSDWVVCDALKEARASRFPFQSVLAELMEINS